MSRYWLRVAVSVGLFLTLPAVAVADEYEDAAAAIGDQNTMLFGLTNTEFWLAAALVTVLVGIAAYALVALAKKRRRESVID